MGENPFLPERHLRISPDERSWELSNFKQVPLNCGPQKRSWNALLPSPDIEQNSDSEQDVNAVTPNFENSQDTLEQQKDFNYSQKLFHIDDGNLYSIFSPIQGRSYGMKPSFLRKQKYTVQECHGRGRKNTRKGLKFHNFLPSESVTSEKDNGCADAKWKIYSECRLREEHGTKQISISNWSQSVPKTFSKNLVCSSVDSEPSSNSLSPNDPMPPLQNHNQDESETKLVPSLNDTCDFLFDSFGMEEKNTLQFNEMSRRDVPQKTLSSHTSKKKDSLNLLLNSLSQKPSLQERNTSCDDLDLQNKNFQKHRRKPIQTRRIVPYKKYLSIVEENDSLPLDLSSKCQIEKAFSQYSEFSNDGNSSSQLLSSYLSKVSSPLKYAENLSVSNFRSDVRMLPKTDEVNGEEEHTDGSSNQKHSNMAVFNPFAYCKNSHAGEKRFLIPPPPPLIGLNPEMCDNTKQQDLKQLAEGRITNDASRFSQSSQFNVQKSVVREMPPKPRRRNQRSIMKQKLEDSFRQNGFLVKTKQVSDGEATFCKFRQLRKCTRYYLKSLEQHLPDEFHKMLKGFLPPKTVLPPVLGSLNPSNET